MDARQQALRQRLLALGFDDMRVAQAGPVPAGPLQDWLAAGRQAEMAWMERSAAKRLQPELVLPGARSLIMLGVNYSTGALQQRGPVWARYALHEDYHDTMKPALVAAGRALEEIYGVGATDYRFYVDTGPVLERGWAAKSGLGFTGKNAMLISRQFGNWLFLAAILTRVELTPDAPLRPQQTGFADVGLLCGKCTRCLDACPTQAFAAPGVVDARRCISYQTIENKGIIPRELRAGIGLHIYGCDICLEVCPWNRFAQEGRRVLLAARFEIPELTLAELLALTPERFAAVFRKTAIKRVKLGGMLRNACIVAGNAGEVALLPALVRLCAHELPMVRAHAVWAVRKLAGAQAAELLAATRAVETEAAVRAEYEATTV
ncbi:MAG: tRNA epoxyqueuosine(34) reductase QueG [Opitutaceae bacterium]|nr:tRNA epoxyqueuosine(34) reductase QueG [Opitutaceae bacterium]MBP9913404.1 tRNA epoxyqueuosine(34) reductase QueG [Opitutaceae bacterium]